MARTRSSGRRPREGSLTRLLLWVAAAVLCVGVVTIAVTSWMGYLQRGQALAEVGTHTTATATRLLEPDNPSDYTRRIEVTFQLPNRSPVTTTCLVNYASTTTSASR